MPIPDPARLALPQPRVRVPGAIAGWCTTHPRARAAHSYGKAYRDVIRALRGEFTHPPDVVAYPRDEADVIRLLDWAGTARVAVIPFGGGSSVVGGVEYRGGDHAGVVSLDLTRLGRVVEVDRTSRAARIQAGVLGPALEEQLRPHGLTLRHFPQSFEFSTLGGWLATRSSGHYATLHTRIDDFVESLRVITPAGIHQSWRLPASGAGPSPDRLFLGSEGVLGVITEAWLRLSPRPAYRTAATVMFDEFASGVAAVRDIVQAGLYPTNCRLLDPLEALLAAAGGASGGASATAAGGATGTPDAGMPEGALGDGRSVLLLEFESPAGDAGTAGDPAAGSGAGGSGNRAAVAAAARATADAALGTAIEIVRCHGGVPAPTAGDGATRSGRVGGSGAGAAWRASFLRMPYLRDALARMGYVVETFETACTWDTAPGLYEAVRTGLATATAQICGAPALVTCRFTHLYPDGAGPYFTVLAPARPGAEVATWDEIKAAASDIIAEHRATITHHHAVGRDHRPWYDRQRPEPFGAVLAAAKRVLDPAGVLNPGVLIDP